MGSAALRASATMEGRLQSLSTDASWDTLAQCLAQDLDAEMLGVIGH